MHGLATCSCRRRCSILHPTRDVSDAGDTTKNLQGDKFPATGVVSTFLTDNTFQYFARTSSNKATNSSLLPELQGLLFVRTYHCCPQIKLT